MKHSTIRRLGATALTLALGLGTLMAMETTSPQPAAAGVSTDPGSRDVIVHLFEWPWASVASECTNVLGPKGFGGVQVSPPQEHVVLPGSGYPWWQDYQPVSYQLVSRRGDRAAFANMVTTCHNAGVKVYVDAVINHTAGGASTGAGSAGSSYSHYSYPAVPYATADFHHCGRNGNDDIASWTDRWEVQNCELVDLADLATESTYVRSKLAGYLNDLRGLGVDGFRVDAAKHMPVADVQAVLDALTGTPYVYHEVIEGGPGEISPTEYTGIGDVTEFRYGDVVGNAFRDGNLSNLNNLANSMLLGSSQAVAFIDNHDTQRNGRARLTYKDATTYALAEAFMVAWPYGAPQVMSSFTFTTADQGPPANSAGITNQVTCGSGWVCEHRWRSTANLVGLRNAAAGSPVTNWWSNGTNQIAFGRGANAYLVFNRGSSLTRTFQTGLPAGNYCDVANGDVSGGTCTGSTYTVDSSGQFAATVPANGVLALHINAMTSGGGGGGCTTVAATFAVNASTVWGENVYVVGSIPALGSWNTANAIPLSSATYPVWQATVSLPQNTSFEYKYIKKNGSSITWENDPNRNHTTGTACSVIYNETWNTQGSGCGTVAVTFAVNASTVWGEDVLVVGDRPELGSWNTANAIPLSSATYPVWRATVNLPASTSIQYKYIKKNGSTVTWESGGNRAQSTGTACTLTFNDTWR